MKRLTFPKSRRLVTNSQFKAVLARKLRVSDGLLTIFVAENDCGHPRLGVSIGKSCGNAVVRNRVKRLIREDFRQNQHRIPAGLDYLVMLSNRTTDIKNTAKQLTLQQVESSLLTLAAGAAEKIVKKGG